MSLTDLKPGDLVRFIWRQEASCVHLCSANQDAIVRVDNFVDKPTFALYVGFVKTWYDVSCPAILVPVQNGTAAELVIIDSLTEGTPFIGKTVNLERVDFVSP